MFPRVCLVRGWSRFLLVVDCYANSVAERGDENQPAGSRDGLAVPDIEGDKSGHSRLDLLVT